MDIKHLKAFLLLAKSLNFTKSAEQMYLSQSAFSRQIVRLEEELGCQLFIRTKRSVELTNFGNTFLGHAEKIVSEYDKCIYDFNSSTTDEFHLRLGILNDLIDDIFPKIINSFIIRNPKTHITYSDNCMSGLIYNLLRDEIDCAYTLTYNSEKISGISSCKLLSQPLYVAMCSNHPLATSTSLRIKDLSECTFIMVMPDIYNLGMIHVNQLCESAGFIPKVAAVISNIHSLLMLVNSNIGIAITARTAKFSAPEGVRLIPIEPDETTKHELESPISILWKTSNTNPSIKDFIESAKKTIHGFQSR